MGLYPLRISILIFALCSTSAGFTMPVVQSLGIPGTDAITLALGGVLSVGFGDVSGAISNPGSRLDSRSFDVMVSCSPSFLKGNFDDDSGEHAVSLSEMGNFSYSCMGRINTFGFLAGASVNREMPFETVYYIPAMGEQQGTSGEMIVDAGFLESYVGLSWDAAEWLCIGGSFGSREHTESFELIRGQEESSSAITDIGWSAREATFAAGFTVPLKMLSIGFSWKSPGEYIPSQIAAGMIFNTGSNSGIGTEVDIIFPEGESIVSARLFSQMQPWDSFFLRGGISFLGSRECVSREGFGFSAGVGVILSDVTVNCGFSRSRIAGEQGWPEYEDMDRYEGSSSVFSLGVGYSLPESLL